MQPKHEFAHLWKQTESAGNNKKVSLSFDTFDIKRIPYPA